MSKEIFLYDENEKKVTSLYHFQNKCYSDHKTSEKNYRITHKFDTPIFIDSNYPPIPKIKLSEFSFDVSIYEFTSTINIYGDMIVAFILKNILKGTTKSIDHNLKPLKPKDAYPAKNI